MKRFKPLLYALLLLTLTACASRTGPPLPPQNKAVGDKWPPEVREFVDVFTTRFASGQPMPTEEQIQRWLHVRTVEIPEGLRSRYALEERDIHDWPLGFADNRGYSSYAKLMPNSDGRQLMRIIRLKVDTSRYCINPYDLAIYTGFRFRPEVSYTEVYDAQPQPPHPRDPSGNLYKSDYVWGMFARSPEQMYLGNNFLKIFLTDDLRCIRSFSANSFLRADGPTSKE